jgi:hypothetical protein
MRISVGPIALARPGWEIEQNSLVSFVAADGLGHPDVLCAQMLCAAAVSGIKTLVLLPGMRTDEPVWKRVVELIGGGNDKAAAQGMRLIPFRMYAVGTGREHAGKAELVYAPGLRSSELEKISESTTAPILTLTDLDDPIAVRKATEIIRVGGDTITLDSEGFEVPVVYDPSGPVYSPA